MVVYFHFEVNAVELCMGKTFIGGAFRQVSSYNTTTFHFQTVNGVAMLVNNGTEWMPLYDNDGVGPAFGINGSHVSERNYLPHQRRVVHYELIVDETDPTNQIVSRQ